MEENFDGWELHIPEHVHFDSAAVKKNLESMPDEEYLNPEERLLATSNKA